MAVTDFGALNEAQKRIWAIKAWKAGRDQSFWFSNGFIGEAANDITRPIVKVTDLTETARGKECVMPMVLDMTGDGVVGDNELEGNEEALQNDTQTIRIDQIRNGVKSKGAMAEQATVLRFRQQAKDKLAFWLSDKIDELMFLTGAGRAYSLKTDLSTRVGSQLPNLSFAADVAAPSSNRILYAGSATSEATITAADKMSWDVIVRAKTAAVTKRLRPIRDRGQGYYCMVISPEQGRDLSLDPTYQAIVARAAPRSNSNPLFAGAKAVVEGVVIHEHNKVINTKGLASASKWGSGGLIEGAQAMLIGAGALGYAQLGNAEWNESDQTDYKNRPGMGYGRVIGMLKPQFKSVFDSNTRQDFGVIAVKTAAAA